LKKQFMALVAAALVAVVTLVVASVGSAAPEAKTYKVALVTDIGGLDDKGFNMLANQGLKRAQKDLGVQGRVFISKSNADYVPNLSAAARQGYDLVVAVGFLMADAVDAVAKRFPNVNFAIIDNSSATKSKPKNLRGLLFSEQEAGYLAGVAAATVSKSKVLSSVGGMKIPPVDAFIAGYQAASKKVARGTKALNGYSQDFVDQAKCKEVALNHIAEGADVVFAVAGQCGLGALSAAKEKGVWGIGVDADQFYLGSHILTSAQKKVDVAVFTTAQQVTQGKFKGGMDALFNVKNGGVGYGKLSAKAPKTLKAKLDAVAKQIAAGKIKGIPRTVK
jgi:basic membrane protein A and related proteins